MGTSTKNESMRADWARDDRFERPPNHLNRYPLAPPTAEGAIQGRQYLILY